MKRKIYRINKEVRAAHHLMILRKMLMSSWWTKIRISKKSKTLRLCHL